MAEIEQSFARPSDASHNGKAQKILQKKILKMAHKLLELSPASGTLKLRQCRDQDTTPAPLNHFASFSSFSSYSHFGFLFSTLHSSHVVDGLRRTVDHRSWTGDDGDGVFHCCCGYPCYCCCYLLLLVLLPLPIPGLMAMILTAV